MAIVQHPTPVPVFFTGLVADTKPTTHTGGQVLPLGAVMYTTDTPAYFLWNGKTWERLPTR